MADLANSTFLLTRRSTLIGGLASLFIPAAGIKLATATVAVDPWSAVAAHTFALHDAMAALPDPFWRVEVGGGKRGDSYHFFNSPSGLKVIDRSAALAGNDVTVKPEHPNVKVRRLAAEIREALNDPAFLGASFVTIDRKHVGYVDRDI